MAALPLFYYNGALLQGRQVYLDEDTSKHVIQVLRMQAGEQLSLADGKGTRAITRIVDNNRKKCGIEIVSVTQYTKPKALLHLAVGFTKNASRNEWLLEKATELGVSSIIPIITTRTEKERTKYDRWHNILVSAMLQSQQHYLPGLLPATHFKELLTNYTSIPQKLVGHCDEDHPRKSLAHALQAGSDALVLIGPEGDFTPAEIQQCMDAGFTGISMAWQRLRTETAAINVCAYFNTINHEVI